MSTTVTAVTGAPATTAPSTGALLRGGGVAAVVAAAATAGLAAAGPVAGIIPAVSGAPIPPSGFAVLTGVFSVVGLLIALALRRFARSPRTAWIRTTVALTALSLVPDALADATVPAKALLMLTHLVAAAIVIPAVARRLRA